MALLVPHRPEAGRGLRQVNGEGGGVIRPLGSGRDDGHLRCQLVVQTVLAFELACTLSTQSYNDRPWDSYNCRPQLRNLEKNDGNAQERGGTWPVPEIIRESGVMRDVLSLARDLHLTIRTKSVEKKRELGVWGPNLYKERKPCIESPTSYLLEDGGDES